MDKLNEITILTNIDKYNLLEKSITTKFGECTIRKINRSLLSKDNIWVKLNFKKPINLENINWFENQKNIVYNFSISSKIDKIKRKKKFLNNLYTKNIEYLLTSKNNRKIIKKELSYIEEMINNLYY